VTTLAILADDLTGAADAAGAFASAGFRTSIVFGDATAGSLDVIVRSTESRDQDAETAAIMNSRMARRVMREQSSAPPRLLYKKIDSALRGHVRRELIEVMAELRETRALVAPALPAERRTTVGARQLINGVPLEQTGLGASAGTSDLQVLFAGDGTLPVTPIDLATVRAGPEEIARVLAGFDSGILIADAETDHDLEAIARGALLGGIMVLAGSAGLARQLATVLPAPAKRSGTALPLSTEGPTLIVAASQHVTMATQIEVLHEAAISIVRPSQELLDGKNMATEPVVDDICAHLAARRSIVLTTAGCARSRLGPAFVARAVADVVAHVVKRQPVGGLVLTGGDIAAAVLGRLDTSEILLGGEVFPAVPWGTLRTPRLRDMPIVTKAGSFGERDALLRCLDFLQG
jgi:D-threonate/D-erythronate kinase